MKKIFKIKFDLISLEIFYENNQIEKIDFINSFDNDFNKSSNNFENEIYQQFYEYFKGLRKSFTLPIKIEGTDFQKSVYNELLKIPYAKQVSYKDIAIIIGCPKGFRAVGNANNKNKIPIIIPCHRVINSDGKIGGYAGGVEIKNYLINLEKSYE
ncbi:MAG TPA: methylated-DNA--[protein]-cysteine S-methyltransferase [Ignavibacteriales bacterium]|nr:methylated-DNA--[protein]-cysteine S-methyltransferase [Ignavibacteriales bacterium]HOL81907.1 methylated-DNA--[protein]-cysteine S-methyltransferase [Ignavibacteriales bacterium]HOM65969.1 methylated-DNA--[protein]-cysteine S-methyltransferase [Ignavibacteriales bacterium]HPD67501.1 methylated-DNA--[protein]-cysteine S-methyltransferase [Ignavibacteriales bacterium]HPP34044.1 methylated-DNA--[protein]-cysteine S-methyltransferase [Ignavibacteriales bacterium]